MILDAFRLAGRNALITGASRGIGAAIAIALAEAGAGVAVHANQTTADETLARVRDAGGKCILVEGDVADSEACRQMIDKTVTELGSIDILVNNAGIIRRAPAENYSEDDWRRVIEVNLNGVFRLCQLAGRHMLQQGGGKIINIASLLSFQGGILVPAYAAAKGAVAQLTKALANEWAAKGICVNSIAPGYIATDNTAALRADEKRNRQILERIPAGRWGVPQDLCGAAVFLASSASDYLHGHLLVVDGGWLAR
ncbi:MAG TPA: 2-dehydro-3-deoxy-D-gluconate 5-dehydrogenase KduD [Terriglobales bacterium]|nr:2-dehydro-3-deoxy-D-gluconate 5-dehydrogenase KduD [Terriglobales bacterium]